MKELIDMTKAKKRCEILSTKDVPKAGKRANEYAENNFEYKLVAKSSEENSYFSAKQVSPKATLYPRTLIDINSSNHGHLSSPPANSPHTRNHRASTRNNF